MRCDRSKHTKRDGELSSHNPDKDDGVAIFWCKLQACSQIKGNVRLCTMQSKIIEQLAKICFFGQWSHNLINPNPKPWVLKLIDLVHCSKLVWSLVSSLPLATLGSKLTNVMEIPSLIVFIDIAFGVKVAGAYSPIVGDSVPTLTLDI